MASKATPGVRGDSAICLAPISFTIPTLNPNYTHFAEWLAVSQIRWRFHHDYQYEFPSYGISSEILPTGSGFQTCKYSSTLLKWDKETFQEIKSDNNGGIKCALAQITNFSGRLS